MIQFAADDGSVPTKIGPIVSVHSVDRNLAFLRSAWKSEADAAQISAKEWHIAAKRYDFAKMMAQFDADITEPSQSANQNLEKW